MKKIDDIFRDSKRVKPSAELWRRIESQVVLKPAGSGLNTFFGFEQNWNTPLFKIAATVALTTCLLGFGLFMQTRHKAGNRVALRADSTKVHVEVMSTDFLDPDLLSWDADLGEMDLDADDSAEEIL